MTSLRCALFLSLLAAPVSGYAAEQLIPAGSIIQCTVSEPKLSSKTADIGDPVLCRVSHFEMYGRSAFPYGSYLVGRFEDYRDPGHLVGKGWMELKFDRMVLPPGTVVPLAAKVVQVPNYPVDKEGRIHGKGHPVRDTLEWMVPVLWPIDLINLPRRGPRPVLKAETRLTLKIMDDLGVPVRDVAAETGPALTPRAPVMYQQPAPEPTPITVEHVYDTPPAPPMPIAMAPVQQQQPTLLVMRNGMGMYASSYWFDGGGRVHYTAMNGAPVVMGREQLDWASTMAVNRQRGVAFGGQPAGY